MSVAKFSYIFIYGVLGPAEYIRSAIFPIEKPLCPSLLPPPVVEIAAGWTVNLVTR
jgi:hypothetical protein